MQINPRSSEEDFKCWLKFIDEWPSREDLTLKEYQEAAAITAIYPEKQAIPYLICGACSEAGEIAGKYKKVIRDNGGVLTAEKKQELAAEVGDLLWYVSQLANELGVGLSQLAMNNLVKLYSRAERGVIKGSGDNR